MFAGGMNYNQGNQGSQAQMMAPQDWQQRPYHLQPMQQQMQMQAQQGQYMAPYQQGQYPQPQNFMPHGQFMGNGIQQGQMNLNNFQPPPQLPHQQGSVEQGPLLEDEPLPFPPHQLLAQYPPNYQQQMVQYYRQMRREYPDLYNQYVDYYNTYYEPMFNGDGQQASPPMENNRNDVQYEGNYEELQQQPATPPQQPYAQPAPQQQPVYQPQPSPRTQTPPQQAPPQQQHQLQRQSSNLSQVDGSLNRQSSIRRQNSMRRNEINQQKNAGGLQRLPSMRENR